MLKVGLIVGSTRPNRFADTPVQWLVEGASARPELRLTVLDLREYRLPFFNELASPVFTGGVYTQPEAESPSNSILEMPCASISSNAIEELMPWSNMPPSAIQTGARRIPANCCVK
jgi:NADPH-dependent FMN reductase